MLIWTISQKQSKFQKVTPLIYSVNFKINIWIKQILIQCQVKNFTNQHRPGKIKEIIWRLLKFILRLHHKILKMRKLCKELGREQFKYHKIMIKISIQELCKWYAEDLLKSKSMRQLLIYSNRLDNIKMLYKHM